MTPLGIEPVTCRFVAWCLNHYATARPIGESGKCYVRTRHFGQDSNLVPTLALHQSARLDRMDETTESPEHSYLTTSGTPQRLQECLIFRLVLFQHLTLSGHN